MSRAGAIQRAAGGACRGSQLLFQRSRAAALLAGPHLVVEVAEEAQHVWVAQV